VTGQEANSNANAPKLFTQVRSQRHRSRFTLLREVRRRWSSALVIRRLNHVSFARMRSSTPCTAILLNQCSSSVSGSSCLCSTMMWRFDQDKNCWTYASSTTHLFAADSSSLSTTWTDSNEWEGRLTNHLGLRNAVAITPTGRAR